MKRNYHRIKGESGKRQSFAIPVFPAALDQHGHRMSTFINTHRRLSLVSQISMQRGAEYRPQQWLPPNGLESQQNVLLMKMPTATEHDPKRCHVKSTKKPKPTQKRLLSGLCCVADNELKYGHDTNKFGA
jgi:hypothetical protein